MDQQTRDRKPKCSPLYILIQQLMAARHDQANNSAWPVNPFPKGMKPGCGTERIYIALLAARPRWLECWELMRAADVSRGGAAWGCRYLAEHGLVRSVPSFRHPQYLRYQAIKAK